MIDCNDQGQEDRARGSTLRFIADLIKDPITMPDGITTIIDPELALGYLIENIGDGSGKRLHTICRVAWAIHLTHPHLTRWQCVVMAKGDLDALQSDDPQG